MEENKEVQQQPQKVKIKKSIFDSLGKTLFLTISLMVMPFVIFFGCSLVMQNSARKFYLSYSSVGEYNDYLYINIDLDFKTDYNDSVKLDSSDFAIKVKDLPVESTGFLTTTTSGMAFSKELSIAENTRFKLLVNILYVDAENFEILYKGKQIKLDEKTVFKID